MRSQRKVDYNLVKSLHSQGLTQAQISQSLGCARSTISYILNKDYRKQVNKKTLERKRKLKSKAVEYKGGKCEICGYNKCIEALEFHHLDSSTKSHHFSRMRSSALNSSKKKELDLCMLLCATAIAIAADTATCECH